MAVLLLNLMSLVDAFWRKKNTLALLIDLFDEFQAKDGGIPTINPLDITMIFLIYNNVTTIALSRISLPLPAFIRR